MNIKLRDYQEQALQNMKHALERGVSRQLAVSPTGCHAKGQEILMHDGTLKRVEDVEVGDLLMGPDSQPRQVLQLARGRDTMARIVPVKGDSFVVNLEHILTLRKTGTRNNPRSWFDIGNQLVDVSVREWLKWSDYRKHIYKLWRTDVLFQDPKELVISPYFMGIWLGDGSRNSPSITTQDQAIEMATRLEAQRFNSRVRSEKDQNKCPVYHIVSEGQGPNTSKIRAAFHSYGLMIPGELKKFIPHEYKTANRGQRLELLAGIIDSDGHNSENVCDYISKDKQLAEDVAYVARSLGFAAYITETEKSSQNGTTGTYYRVSLSGGLSDIPTRLERKRFFDRRQVKRVNVTGFNVEVLEEDDYYGFQVDGDQRYLLGDFTVTHNSGKTMIFAHVPKKVMPGRMLVIAHRGELLRQAKDTFELVHKDMLVEIEQAESYASLEADVVVATVQTLGKKGSNRILRFPRDHFTTVVVDEAHHATANNSTYTNILNYFKPVLRLGVTATPQRGDGVRLYDLFDEIVFSRSIKDMITEGYLVNMVGFRVNTNVDISGIATRAGDYALNELSKAVNIEDRNKMAVAAYLEHAKDRKAITFCVDVAHAENMNQAFVKAGIPSAVITGATSKEEREEIYAAFDRGDLMVLNGVFVLTEGFDQPDVGCIILARPTKSPVLYIQSVGRGLRLSPGKEDCIVLDLCDVTAGKKPIGLPTLMGLPPDFDLQGTSLLEAEEKFKALEEEAPQEAARVKSLDDIEEAWERIDMFLPPPLNAELLEITDFVWTETSLNTFVLQLQPGEKFVVTENALGKYSIEFVTGFGPNKQRKPIKEVKSLEEALSRTDAWVRNNRSEQVPLIEAEAEWHGDPPTEKQIKWLKKFDVPITKELSKGQAKRILDKLFAENPKPQRSAKQEWAIRHAQNKRRF